LVLLQQPTKTDCAIASELEDKLYVTLENPWFTIEKHGVNAHWVGLAFGQTGYDEIKGMTS
jgi:hypothetical protein